jgi:hypothetical protein
LKSSSIEYDRFVDLNGRTGLGRLGGVKGNVIELGIREIPEISTMTKLGIRETERNELDGEDDERGKREDGEQRAEH